VPSPAGLPSGTALVGRDDDLDRLTHALQREGEAAVVVAGPAGVGKSRFALEGANLAESLGYSVGVIVASQAASAIPLGAFAPLLSRLDDTGMDSPAFLQRTAEAILARLGSQDRRLLVIDDAHQLDDVSAALVFYLAQTQSCSLVLTLRTRGIAPDAVTALWKDGYAVRLDLQLLTESDVEQLALAELGAPMAKSDTRWLWTESSGNALFLRELLMAAREQDVLEQRHGVWTLRQHTHRGARIEELVATRLAGLPEATLEVLNALAVAGPIGASLVETMIGGPALEDAESRGLVDMRHYERRAMVSPSHPLYSSVLLEKMAYGKRKGLSALLASALTATGARRHDDVLRVAKWHLDAGSPDDPGLLTAAAKIARTMLDSALAADLSRAAVEAGGGVEAGLVLAETYMLWPPHNGVEAESVLASLVPLCTTDQELAGVASARAFNLSSLLGDKDAGVRIAEECLAIVSDAGAQLRLQGRLAAINALAGDILPAIAGAMPLIESGIPALEQRGCYLASFALALHGEAEEAVKLSHRGVDALRRDPDRARAPETQLNGAVVGHLAAGRLRVAEAAATDGLRACVQAEDEEGAGTFSLYKGWVQVTQGRLREATQAFRDAATVFGTDDDVRWAMGAVALATGMSGDAAAASAALVDLEAAASGWGRMLDLELTERGRAWASVAAGELSIARAHLQAVARVAADKEHRLAEALLLNDLARLGEAREVADRLSELAHITDGDLMPAFAAHASALSADGAADLEVSAGRLEELGVLLVAAEAYHEAAARFQAEGLLRRASAAAQSADRLVRLCENPRTPALATKGELPRLTRRQREVAELAARGASDQEIASRLFLSVRTVETHLFKAYATLGITGRDELARALELT
jgi:DNA-binding NarL/FixJ family response regulator